MASKIKLKSVQSKWADEDMVSAMKAVADKKWLLLPSSQYLIRTLDDRINGHV